MKAFKKIGIAAMFVVFFSALDGSSAFSQPVRYSNPPWAPAYYPGVRYYYIPDLEMYYDLSNQDFVYLDDGQWMFSYGLPSIYAGYDLYNAFVVALDAGVYQPWMHHQFYVSHYPRYYYRSVYNHDENANIRGFNENERKPISLTQGDKERMNAARNNFNTERKSGFSRPPQVSHYYGENIGRPVMVQPQMREGREEEHERHK